MTPGKTSLGRLQTAGICLLLAAITLAVFYRTFDYGFVNLDDDLIVTDNPHITAGLSAGGVAWAFTHFDSYFYTPLTSISHMLDCSIFGLGQPGGHHLVNVILHAASAVALFLALRAMTGAPWRCAFVAAVFAIHPLHVESVAWISERKDVLGGFFFMLTLWAYAHYARVPKYARGPKSPARHLLVALLYTLALLSKPSVVTLPFVLLLLDYWPLGRFDSTKTARLIVEKIPLLLLSSAASVVAVLAQGGAIQSVRQFPVTERLGNAFVSAIVYIAKTIYPSHLAAFYPHPGDALPAWRALASLLALLAVTAAVFAFCKTHRYLVTGWLWYLGMLVPMSGIVQVGIFARADRFTYLPQIGLCIMGVWGLADWLAKWEWGPKAAGAIMGILTAELMAIAWVQAGYWANSIELWTHALTCTTGNYQAENSLGAAFYNAGDTQDALPHFHRALEINPRYDKAHNNLGGALLQAGDITGAIGQFRQALETDPRSSEILNSLGDACYQSGDDKSAIAQYRRALDITPDYVIAQSNLAWMLATSPDDSLRDGAKAVELARAARNVSGDRNPLIIRTLAAACAEAGKFDDALQAAQDALDVANAQGNAHLAAELQSEITLYHAHTPFHRRRTAPPQ